MNALAEPLRVALAAMLVAAGAVVVTDPDGWAEAAKLALAQRENLPGPSLHGVPLIGWAIGIVGAFAWAALGALSPILVVAPALVAGVFLVTDHERLEVYTAGVTQATAWAVVALGLLQILVSAVGPGREQNDQPEAP